MDKELAGQPLWLWGLGAVIVVGGYLYFKSHATASNTPSAGTPSGQGGGKSSSTSSFKEWITQHNASSGTHKRRA